MNSFKDFGIKPTIIGFVGDKIKIERVLNRKITVEDFKVDISKYEKGSGKCLHLQVTVDGEKRVIFSGSTTLMDMIQQVPKDKFPFDTIIVKENERYEFT